MQKFALGAALALAAITTANAADLPAQTYTKAPAYVAPVYNWNGFYIGGNAGYGWGDSSTVIVTPSNSFPAGYPLTKAHPDGGLIGGQIGYNWQFSPNWLLGVEADFDATNIKGSEITFSPLINRNRTDASSKIDWITTVTGRAGYTWNNVLFYVKGGGAWAHNKAGSDTFNAAGRLTSSTTGSETRDGWTVGAGIEYGFAPNWSAKAEYNYLDFGNSSVTRTYTAGNLTGNSVLRNNDLTMHIFKVGINYRFGWSPVVARY